jgi:hypothetical protein
MCAFYHEKNQKRDPQTSSSVEPPQQVSNLILKNRGIPSGTLSNNGDFKKSAPKFGSMSAKNSY